MQPLLFIIIQFETNAHKKISKFKDTIQVTDFWQRVLHYHAHTCRSYHIILQDVFFFIVETVWNLKYFPLYKVLYIIICMYKHLSVFHVPFL